MPDWWAKELKAWTEQGRDDEERGVAWKPYPNPQDPSEEDINAAYMRGVREVQDGRTG